MPAEDRDQVFICYSRKDALWCERLRATLKPLKRRHKLRYWWDGDTPNPAPRGARRSTRR